MTTRLDYRCHISQRLDAIPMTKADREAARAYLQQGVRVADAMLRIAAWLRSTVEFLGRGLRGRRERLTH